MIKFGASTFREYVKRRTVEYVPLLDIVLTDGASAYVSNRRLQIRFLNDQGVPEDRVYVRKLLKVGSVSQDLSGAASSATFTLSNVDRVLSRAARDHDFFQARVTYRVFCPELHLSNQSLEQSSYILFSGYVTNIPQYDGREFPLQCRAGLFTLSQPFPRRRIQRACTHEFDDGCYCPYSGYGVQQRRDASGTPIANDFVPVADLQGVVGPSGETFIAGTLGEPAGASDFGPPPDFGGPAEGREGAGARPGFIECPKTFEGCFTRGMQRFFGGLRYVAAWASGSAQRGFLKRAFGLSGSYSSVSSVNDSVYNYPVPMVYCSAGDMPRNPLTGDVPLFGFITTPLVFQWRAESEYLAVEAIVSLGRVGKAADSQYTAALAPPNSRRGEDVEGIREVYINGLAPHEGQFPRIPGVGVFRSTGRIGEPATLPVFLDGNAKTPGTKIKKDWKGRDVFTSWDQIGGDLQGAFNDKALTHIHADGSQGTGWHNPVTNTDDPAPPPIWMSQFAGFFARVFDKNAGINNPQVAAKDKDKGSDAAKYGGSSVPEVRARIAYGRSVWVYIAPDDRTYGPKGNPALVALDVFLEAMDKKYATKEAHARMVDLQSVIDLANYCNDPVPNTLNPQMNAPRYVWSGVFSEVRPAVDQIDAVLRDCYAFRVWRGDKIAFRPLNAGNFASDNDPRPAFQEFVNIIDGSLKCSIPQPRFNTLNISFADADFDFQKNSTTVYSETHQRLVATNGNRMELTKTEALTGTPTVDQANRLGSRMLKDELGGINREEWRKLREVELTSTFMMAELEVGDVTYIAHTLIPDGGGWFRITSITYNPDFTISFKLRTFRTTNYDDVLIGLSSVELAQFGYNPFIPGSGGIAYQPLPRLLWADEIDPREDIGALSIPHVGTRLKWLPYTSNPALNFSDAQTYNKLLLAVQIYRTTGFALRDRLEPDEEIARLKYTLHLPLPPFLARIDDPYDPDHLKHELVRVLSVDHDLREVTLERGIEGEVIPHARNEIFYLRLFAGGFLGKNVTAQATTWVVDSVTADFLVGEKYLVNGELVKVLAFNQKNEGKAVIATIRVARAQKFNDDDEEEIPMPAQPHPRFSQIRHQSYYDATPDFRQQQFGTEGVYEYLDAWIPGGESPWITTTTTTTETASTTTEDWGPDTTTTTTDTTTSTTTTSTTTEDIGLPASTVLMHFLGGAGTTIRVLSSAGFPTAAPFTINIGGNEDAVVEQILGDGYWKIIRTSSYTYNSGVEIVLVP